MVMMKKRGISEETVIVENVNPDVSEAELVEHAELDIEPSSRPPFRITWIRSFGPERERLSLDPGKTAPLRVSDAREMLKEVADQGVVMYSMDADEAEIKQARVKGLQASQKFHRDRGVTRITAYRKTHGLSLEELEEQKHDIFSFHIHAAQEEAVKTKLDLVRRGRNENGEAA